MSGFEFDSDLIRRYDGPGPRYTSYPTAVQFSAEFGEGLGTVALKRGSTPAIRTVAFIAALIVFAWIVATAIGHRPYLPI